MTTILAELAPGATAPSFTLPTDGNGRVALSDLRGKQVVLYFYPKDDTSGCTAEAQDFARLHDDFIAAGAVVLGISKDSVKKHDAFKAKYGLPFPLLSDEASVTEDYGVWVEKSMYGRKYMGIERSTFLIGTDGKLRQVWRKVKVPGHAEAVLKAVRAA